MYTVHVSICFFGHTLESYCFTSIHIIQTHLMPALCAYVAVVDRYDH